MYAFYLDETLSAAEQDSVRKQLIELGEAEGARNLQFKKIETRLPNNILDMEDADAIKLFSDTWSELGVSKNSPSLLVVPKVGIRWSLLLEMAFENKSGLFPYLVNPWKKMLNGTFARKNFLHVRNFNNDPHEALPFLKWS